jgi:hypothetical protein
MLATTTVESGSSAGLLGLAGYVSVPDLECSGDVPALGAQQSGDVLVDEASLLRESGEHPPLGRSFPEEDPASPKCGSGRGCAAPAPMGLMDND